MAICKHCMTESTLVSADADRCPICGMPYEFNEDDWRLDESAGGSSSPDQTMPLSNLDESERMEGFGDQSTQREMEDFEPDATEVFGGLGGVDDDDDSIALGGDDDDDDDVTQGEADYEQTQAFVDPTASKPPLFPEGGDQQQPPPAAENPFDRTLPTDSSPAGHRPPRSSREDATMPVDLSESDWPDSGSQGGSAAGTQREDSGYPEDSDTLDFGTNRRSDFVDTPESRSLTGLSSGQTAPQGKLGEDHASRSLTPGGSREAPHESVRLRAQTIARDVPLDDADYQIEEGPFVGGMGQVFRARQGTMDRSIALKSPKTGTKSSDNERKGIISEAVITGQLEHPNIIPVHDAGYGLDGVPFYSMKWVEGEEWEKALKEKRLSRDENIDILIKVSQAIAYAHSRNVIHRDLKPGNIWLGSFGEVLVMDWGLAARLDGKTDIVPSGTPIYMPPETALEYLDHVKVRVANGHGTGDGSPRYTPPGTYSDIYLLGALLFKIVTGRAPHRGKNTFECLKNAARNRISRTRKKGELMNIAYKAMATDPAKRHRDVGEFIEELKAYQDHEQSNVIAGKAASDLRHARQLVSEEEGEAKDAYRSLSRAQHGFENALELWKGNTYARRKLKDAKREYAQTAYTNGDYDLALTMLDPGEEEDAALLNEVTSSQAQRNRKVRLFKTFQYAAYGLLGLCLVFIGISVIASRDAFSARRAAQAEQEKATLAKASASKALGDAKVARDEAADAKEDARIAKDEATKAEADAEEAQDEAEIALADAEKAKGEADTAKKAARIAKGEANTAKQEASAAKDEAALAITRAREAQGEAVLGKVRAALSEDGAYAAWVRLTDAEQKVRAGLLPQDALQGDEWNNLRARTNWKQEATPLRKGLKKPLIAATPDGGKFVLLNGQSAEVYLTHDLSGQAAKQVQVPGGVDRMAVSGSGGYIAMLSGGSLSVIDAKTGKQVRMLKGQSVPDKQQITALAFHPTKPILMTGDAGTGVTLWNIKSEQEVAEAASYGDKHHQRPIAAVGFSPNGVLRFATDVTGETRFYRGTRSMGYSHAAFSYDQPVITVGDISNDGRFAYGSANGDVYVVRGPWKAEDFGDESPSDGSQLVAYRDSLDWVGEKADKVFSLRNGVAVSSVSLTNTSQVIATGGHQIVQSTAKGRDARSRSYHAKAILSCVVTAQGAAYTTDEDGRLVKWDLDSPVVDPTVGPGPNEARAPVASIEFDPDTKRIIVADRAGFVRRWADPQEPNDYDLMFSGHARHDQMQAWQIGGQQPRILTVAGDNRACVWDAATGLQVDAFDLGEHRSVALSHDKKWLLAGTARQAMVNGEELRNQGAVAFPLSNQANTFKGLWLLGPRVSTLCTFNLPDSGETLYAVGLRDGQTYLWNPKRPEQREYLISSSRRATDQPITCLTWNGRSNSLYSGSNNGFVTRWSYTGEQWQRKVMRLPKPLRVRKIEFSNSGSILVVQQDIEGAVATVLSKGELTPTELSPVSGEGAGKSTFALLDAALSNEGHSVFAVAKEQEDRPLVYRLDGFATNASWKPAALSSVLKHSLGGQSVERLSTSADGGLLFWGAGIVRLMAKTGPIHAVVTKVDSRAPISLVSSPHNKEKLLAVSQAGAVSSWTGGNQELEGSITQSRLNLSGGNVLACKGFSFDSAFVARRSDAGVGVVVEEWDLTDNRPLRALGPLPSGACRAIAAARTPQGPVVVCGVRNGQSNSLVFYTPDNTIEPVDLSIHPNSKLLNHKINSISIDPTSGKLAAVLNNGDVLQAMATGPHLGVRNLGLKNVTAAAFTPGGERLVVGSKTGQVRVLRITQDGTQNMLTLTGHSDRISVLRFAERDGSKTLLSGDASGRVILNAF